MIVILSLISVAVILLGIYLTQSSKGYPNRLGGWPIVGQLVSFLKEPANVCYNAAKKFNGVFTVTLAGTKLVIISSRSDFPTLFKAREEDLSFHSPLVERYLYRSIFGIHDATDIGRLNSGLIRKLILNQKYDSIIASQIEKALDELPDKGQLDVSIFARKLAVKTITMIITGEDVDDNLCQLLDRWESGVIPPVWVQLLPKFLAEFTFRKADKNRVELIELLIQKVQKQRQECTSAYVQALLDHTKENGEKMSDREIVLCQLGSFFAGFATTGNAVAQELMLAGDFPEKADELRKELRTVKASESKLLQAWVLESVRVTSSVLLSFRTVMKDDFMIGGVHCPKGSLLAVDSISETISAEEFGRTEETKEKLEFEPEHFLRERSEDCQKYGVLAWGAGVHSCPGKSLAQTELRLILAAMLRQMAWTSEVKQKLEFSAITPFARQSYIINYEKIK